MGNLHNFLKNYGHDEFSQTLIWFTEVIDFIYYIKFKKIHRFDCNSIEVVSNGS